MKIILTTIIILLNYSLFSQNITVSGTLKDADNGEDIFGATIMLKDIQGTGAKTNSYGFYSFTISIGLHTIIYKSTGYEQKEMEFTFSKDTIINVELNLINKITEIQEVEITANKENSNITKSGMSVITLTPKEIETIPVIFGEKDIVKTLQLTPGVKAAGDGNAGFYVRGGGADQNLVLLDEATVYNASHLLGFFSVFNSDAIKEVSLYKSAIAPEYGGRASAVMDVKMKEGNNKNFGISGGIGLISSRLTVEGPIIKEKASFIISGRRTYFDLFLKA
jgi:hypothetical protein